jgi:hypothetical protein
MNMTRRDTIAEAMLASRVLFHRYLVGFDDTNHTKQASNLPNHVAWCLGHCALTLHRGVERINREPLPEGDFHSPPADLVNKTPPPPSPPARAGKTGAAGTTSAAPTRYNTESVAFQSTPTDNPVLYPRFGRCVEIFDSACHRYAEVVRALPEERLDAMIQMGQIQIPIWASALRMGFHNAHHCGQVSDLRRALGMKSIFA